MKVAVLTGAATGMGAGVAEDLAEKGWKVVILDKNTIEGPKTATKIGGDFYSVDVTVWTDQYKAFEAVFEKYGRIDFVFGNAGLPDRVDYFALGTTLSLEEKPNMLCLDINLLGPTYTSILALYYFRKNPKSVVNPLLLLTSSGAGLYPTPVQPLYCAAKHGVIGLARSMGERVEPEGFRVCALVPGLVPTRIVPKETIDRAGKTLITPVSHIVTAVNDMLNSKKNATVCEASVDQLFYRDPPPFMDEAQERVINDISKNMGDEFIAQAKA